MSGSEAIYGKVVRELVEALSVDEAGITPSASLQGDLGAESIDFLDIVFRLERAFAIKIPRGELFPESVFQGNPDSASRGQGILRRTDDRPHLANPTGPALGSRPGRRNGLRRHAARPPWRRGDDASGGNGGPAGVADALAHL